MSKALKTEAPMPQQPIPAEVTLQLSLQAIAKVNQAITSRDAAAAELVSERLRIALAHSRLLPQVLSEASEYVWPVIAQIMSGKDLGAANSFVRAMEEAFMTLSMVMLMEMNQAMQPIRKMRQFVDAKVDQA